MGVQVGDRAPPFRLPKAPGEEVDVGALLGEDRVVLLFFPLAFSPTCTAEMRGFRQRWSDFSAPDVSVFGICVDSPFVTDRFRREEDIPFPVLSDFNRDVSRTYGVLYSEFYGLEGVSKRAVFVVDATGRVIYRWVTEDASVEPDYGTVRAAVRGGDGARETDT